MDPWFGLVYIRLEYIYQNQRYKKGSRFFREYALTGQNTVLSCHHASESNHLGNSICHRNNNASQASPYVACYV